jgi:hypothetical protein
MNETSHSIAIYSAIGAIGALTISICCLCTPFKKHPKKVRFNSVVEQTEITPLIPSPPSSTSNPIEKIDVEIRI